MGHISVLNSNMVNMIAAGEVIERPASVVKELMENSIDAGATEITVKIQDGGRKLISVTDNGCGMDADDIQTAFEPHATSKIKNQAELASISTLGFRGEALASIASVAQLRAVSRVKDSLNANCIEIDCGKRQPAGPCSGDYGTTIEIRNLFYKLPARKKFLRTANTEASHIAEQFNRIALGGPFVPTFGSEGKLSSDGAGFEMALIHNNRQLHHIRSGEGLRQRITALFSSEISENLIKTQNNEKNLEITAFLGKPHISRTNSKLQYVFLNGRYIRDRFISHAIKEAYRGFVEPGRFPVVFLFITMPCRDYDINVHPTKIEVRFYNANLVHSQVLGCLREKLLNLSGETPVKLPAGLNETKYLSAGQGLRINDALAEFFNKYKPARPQKQLNFTPGRNVKAEYQTAFQTDAGSQVDKSPASLQKRFLQIHDSFIITQTKDGFVIIDQHALHERIMYEKLRKRLSTGNLQSQKLLMPEAFEVSDTQAAIIEANAKLIDKLGIELKPFGPQTWAIQSFPAILTKVEPVDFVRDLLDLLSSTQGSQTGVEKPLAEILNMTACKAAIKAGWKLTEAEMEQLIADKDKLEQPGSCPHGRPTTIKFSIDELEKQFRRR